MPTDALLAVIFGALLHASWNALLKGGQDKFMGAVLVSTGAAVLALLAIPFVPMPALASWPYLLGSAAIHFVYFSLVVATYRLADMSYVYPLMRGMGPLLVALLSGVLLGEYLSFQAWIGVLLIGGSAAGLTLTWRSGQEAGWIPTLLAVANAGPIAAYTFTDGVGARLSGHAAAYTFWVFVLTAVPLLIWSAWRRPRDLIQNLRHEWRLALVGGACTLASYGLALWAMTRAPIATVSALRETSILFGIGIGALVLKERISAARLAAGLGIALGVVALRLA